MKKIISMLLVVIMALSLNITTFADDPYEFETTIPVAPTSIKTEKTKFGTTRYYGPIVMDNMYLNWKLKTVTVVKAQLLKRYVKQKEKIEVNIEFTNTHSFYFYTNTPGKYYLKIVLTSPKGKTVNISEDYYTEIFVPDSKYSFEKSKKSTISLSETFKYNEENTRYEHIRPIISINVISRDIKTIGESQELPEFIISNISPGWELYSVKVIKAEIMDKYAAEAKNLKTKIRFYTYTSFSLTVNMPGAYFLEVKMKSPSGKIVNLTIQQYMNVFTSDGVSQFHKEEHFFKKINKTYKYKGENIYKK